MHGIALDRGEFGVELALACRVARGVQVTFAQQVADLVEAMHADAGHALEILRVDGGAAASDFLMQLQADLLGVPLERPRVVETTAQGTAFMAGLASGLWADAKQLDRVRAVDRRFEPAWSVDRREAARARWKSAVASTRSWKPQEEPG